MLGIQQVDGLIQIRGQSLIDILTTPKNALTRQYKKIFDYDGVDLEFEPDALEEIAVRMRDPGRERGGPATGAGVRVVRYGIRHPRESGDPGRSSRP